MKPSLAFVDHSFHKKTRSGDFLREIFSKDFQVNDFWDDQWKGGRPVSVEDINKHDYVFYFQSITPIDQLHLVKAQMIWAPMYDGTPMDFKTWQRLSELPIKVISFSKRIHKQALMYGLPSFKCQYYLKPNWSSISKNHDKKIIYFWYRGSLKVNDFIKLINPIQIKKLVIRQAPDPRYQIETIDKKTLKDYKIEILNDDKFDKNLHQQLLNECDIFVAPRKKEGIGITTLEAMSQGKCIIAWKAGTMDEYIKDNKNGFLIDNRSQKKLNLNNFNNLISQMKIDYQNGYDRWNFASKELNPFIKIPFKVNKKNPLILYYYLKYKLAPLYYSPFYTIRNLILWK